MIDWHIVCDFDGTITPTDVIDNVLQRFAGPEWETIEQQWLDGHIGSRECLSRQLALIKATPTELLAYFDSVEIDPDFPDFVDQVIGLGAIGKALGGKLFPHPDQAELRQKMAERWAKNDKRAYLASFDAIVGWGVQERLSRVTCPTLIVSADRDYTPVALKEAYVKLLPDARLVVIENSRHATPLDQPQRFNQTVLEFLTTIDTPNQDH